MALISIKEAAQRLEVAETTVRRRIRNGEVRARQVARPQGFVWMVELPDEVSSESGEAHRDNDSAGLRELVDVLKDEVSTLKGELTERGQEMQQLHVLLQQAQAALPAPKENRRWWRLW